MDNNHGLLEKITNKKHKFLKFKSMKFQIRAMSFFDQLQARLYLFKFCVFM